MRQTHWPKLGVIVHRHEKALGVFIALKSPTLLAPWASAKAQQTLGNRGALRSLQQHYQATLPFDLQVQQLRWRQRGHRALNHGNVLIIAEPEQAFDPKHMGPHDRSQSLLEHCEITLLERRQHKGQAINVAVPHLRRVSLVIMVMLMLMVMTGCLRRRCSMQIKEIERIDLPHHSVKHFGFWIDGTNQVLRKLNAVL
jgi:hypothetical protein